MVFEEKLINSADKSVLFGAVVADTPQQAVELEQHITQSVLRGRTLIPWRSISLATSEKTCN